MKNKALILLLGLLGFASGCEKEQGQGQGEPSAYGTPTAIFTIKGRVTDAAGAPVQGIRVTAVEAWHQNIPSSTFIPDQEIERNTLSQRPVYTSETGEYVLNNSCFDWTGFRVNVRAEDVDGQQNGGLFTSKDTEVEITATDRIREQPWTSEYEKQAAAIELKKEE